MVNRLRFIFCGGGTGGHLFPGIAVARAIRKRAPESAILFVGTQRGLEESVLPRHGFDFTPIKSAGFKNLGLGKKLKALMVLPGGIFQGYRLIKSFKPSVVVGLGGYSAFPLMIASIFKRLRRAIQEQNTIPGLTNRVLAPFVHRIFISFETTASYFPKAKTILTGNPVREGLCSPEEKTFETGARHILILGGSLGAHTINTLCMAALPRLLNTYPDLELYMQTGKSDFDLVAKTFEKFGSRVKVFAFIENIETAYRWADLVIARAGATTLSEIAVCGIPAILIPYPHAANNHQMENARFFASRGGAILLPEPETDQNSLLKHLEPLLNNSEKLQAMARNMKAHGHPGAADTIADILLNLASARGKIR